MRHRVMGIMLPCRGQAALNLRRQLLLPRSYPSSEFPRWADEMAAFRVQHR
jgi:hypothetical protein